MKPAHDIGDKAWRETTHAVREARPWLVALGRFGFFAKGIVYMLVALFALQAAFGERADTKGSAAALEHVGHVPFGRYLLIAMGVGIAGYALWRFLQALMDTENKGTGGKGLAVRVGYFVIALVHVGLAASAFALASGGQGKGDDSAPGWTAQLMSQPFGQWLVAAVGAIVVAYGAMQVRRAWTRKFREKLELTKMSTTEDRWTTRLGRMGYAARGVVFGVIGTFLVIAAIHAEPGEARGLAGALDALAQQPWGSAVLAIVALGLAAYGLFMLVEARYRRMVIT